MLFRLAGVPLLGAGLAGVLGLGAAALALLLLQGLGRTPLQPGLGALGTALVSLVPAAAELVLPVAALLGAAVVGARLAERNALLGLAASGVRLRRLLPSLLVVGFGFAGLLAVLSHEVAPRGRAAARTTLQGGAAALRLRPGQPAIVGREQVLVRAGAVSPAGWSEVFVATSHLVATAQTGRLEGARLVLDDGEATPFPDRSWTLRFAQAEVPLSPPAGRVELEERSSGRLRDLVGRMQANGRAAHSESLALAKRFTLPAMVPLLVLIAFAAGARSGRPGAVVAGGATVWWVGLRVADKLPALVGVGWAAGLPVLVALALVWVLWRSWRLA